MSHAHRKHAWVKRRGAAVRQRRAMRNGARMASLTVMPFPSLSVATIMENVAARYAMEQPITELSLPSFPAPITFSGRISADALRKIAAMFPMEDSHEQE